MFKKNFLDITIDFNYLSTFLSNNNVFSFVSSKWIGDHILDSCFQIRGVQHTVEFKSVFEDLNNKLNKKNKPSNLDIFYSHIPGAHSNTHADLYDVFLINVFGKVMYTVKDKEYILEKGDLLNIEKNTIHTGIGLGPRITLSYELTHWYVI